ncbi:MAG: 4Fe-4S binding protein [Anaerolineales bacterium]|jgi:polyferredoxin|nr:4Fe-4S binding protein [Anaerolineales bacterium]
MSRQTSKLMQIRKGMLWFAVIATFVIGIRHLLPGKAGSGGSFDAFCPFGAIETLWVYLTRGQTLKTTNLLNFAVLGGVLAVSLVAGRAFCGWMCPLGAVQEGLANWARRLGAGKRPVRGKPTAGSLPLSLPAWADRPLRWAKYLILAIILVASVFAVYPPLHTICPARAVFSFKLETGLLWSVLLVFLVTSFLVERVWCKYLCPLGAALAIFNKISPVRIVGNSERCNHCGRCDVECSMGIQAVPENLRDTECIRCLECLETCARDESLELKVL